MKPVIRTMWLPQADLAGVDCVEFAELAPRVRRYTVKAE